MILHEMNCFQGVWYKDKAARRRKAKQNQGFLPARACVLVLCSALLSPGQPGGGTGPPKALYAGPPEPPGNLKLHRTWSHRQSSGE